MHTGMALCPMHDVAVISAVSAAVAQDRKGDLLIDPTRAEEEVIALSSCESRRRNAVVWHSLRVQAMSAWHSGLHHMVLRQCTVHMGGSFVPEPSG